MEDDILVVESTEESTSSSETDSTVSDGNLTEGLKEAVGNSFGSTLERSSPDNKVLERKNTGDSSDENERNRKRQTSADVRDRNHLNRYSPFNQGLLASFQDKSKASKQSQLHSHQPSHSRRSYFNRISKHPHRKRTGVNSKIKRPLKAGNSSRPKDQFKRWYSSRAHLKSPQGSKPNPKIKLIDLTYSPPPRGISGDTIEEEQQIGSKEPQGNCMTVGTSRAGSSREEPIVISHDADTATNDTNMVLDDEKPEPAARIVNSSFQPAKTDHSNNENGSKVASPPLTFSNSPEVPSTTSKKTKQPRRKPTSWELCSPEPVEREPTPEPVIEKLIHTPSGSYKCNVYKSQVTVYIGRGTRKRAFTLDWHRALQCHLLSQSDRQHTPDKYIGYIAERRVFRSLNPEYFDVIVHFVETGTLLSTTNKLDDKDARSKELDRLTHIWSTARRLDLLGLLEQLAPRLHALQPWPHHQLLQLARKEFQEQLVGPITIGDCNGDGKVVDPAEVLEVRAMLAAQLAAAFETLNKSGGCHEMWELFGRYPQLKRDVFAKALEMVGGDLGSVGFLRDSDDEDGL